MPQVLLGWKYGDSVDEKAKIHPQLRVYKALTEKVRKHVRFVKNRSIKERTWRRLCSVRLPHLYCSCFRRKRFTDGQ